MVQLEKLFEQAPEIIKAAAKRPLGIVALIILTLSTLGFLFFAESPDWIKLAVAKSTNGDSVEASNGHKD